MNRNGMRAYVRHNFFFMSINCLLHFHLSFFSTHTTAMKLTVTIKNNNNDYDNIHKNGNYFENDIERVRF